jgi:MFS transporter, DHA1 family, inner membrane transport protein
VSTEEGGSPVGRADAVGGGSPDRRGPRTALARWYLAAALYGVPQAAAPILFALIALPITGSPTSGAAMVLASTLAQIVGAVPFARLGRRFHPSAYLRALILVRTVSVAGVAVAAAADAPFPVLIVAAAGAGLTNGAAFGCQRAILNELVAPERLPRALGLAATLNEITFVSAPVLAAVVGAASPVVAVLVVAAIGVVQAAVIPAVPRAAVPSASSGSRMLTPVVVVWLCCAAATAAAVAAVEISAVALAVRFDLPPSAGAVFTVALCVMSIAGGVVVSVRNVHPGRRTALGYVLGTALGSVLVASQLSIATTIVGAALVGAFLAPLATFYSLTMDALAPPERRAELFSLLRTANAIGVIALSALLALASLAVALVVAAVAVGAACVLVLGMLLAGRRDRVDASLDTPSPQDG